MDVTVVAASSSRVVVIVVAYIVPHCEKLASEALRYGSHSFFCYTANSPYPPLPRSIHQMASPV